MTIGEEAEKQLASLSNKFAMSFGLTKSKRTLAILMAELIKYAFSEVPTRFVLNFLSC
jgi:hypothetical protein